MLMMFSALAATNWSLACLTFADLTGRIGFPDAALKLAEWYKQSTTGPIAAEILRSSSGLDVTERLSDLQVPTLVMHRIDDPLVPFVAGQAMAARIPNARFPLEGGANLPIFGDQAPIIRAARAFLAEGLPTQAQVRSVALESAPCAPSSSPTSSATQQ
jgi:pimeloyl-ACP methyl ester carboxylesterase